MIFGRRSFHQTKAPPGNYRMGLMLLEAYAQITFVHMFAQSLFGIFLSSGPAYLFGGIFSGYALQAFGLLGPLVTLNRKTSFL